MIYISPYTTQQKVEDFHKVMVKGQNQLSQAEIWDDSALVKSWDDALQEYKVCLRIFVSYTF